MQAINWRNGFVILVGGSEDHRDLTKPTIWGFCGCRLLISNIFIGLGFWGEESIIFESTKFITLAIEIQNY